MQDREKGSIVFMCGLIMVSKSKFQPIRQGNMQSQR
jgi:hypothetical protein